MREEAQKIEALLFLAGEAVAKSELARLISCPTDEVNKFLTEIQEELIKTGLALTLTDTHAQLTTNPAVSDWLNQYLHDEAQDISGAAAETLAIIAYRGPITRVDIDAIRGVDNRRMIRQLLARGLVRRSGLAGQAPKYVITEEFLQRLGVTATNQLPDYDRLSSEEKIEKFLTKE
ncbi:MAG: SMC-Scp complex subunit ScpB [Candidatus Andersenbacteria bacterium]|nr:SMC-Scp complex subunit ScpB [bacterium]MDZ4225796.1 SMC-Scp complex subunit ScpB [Candidatus Andersenbacteria bacterium]